MAQDISPTSANLDLYSQAAAQESLDDGAPLDRKSVSTFALDIGHIVAFAAGLAIASSSPITILALGIGLVIYFVRVTPTVATQTLLHSAVEGDDSRQKTVFSHNINAVPILESHYRHGEIGDDGLNSAANGDNHGAGLLDDDLSRNERLVDPGEWKAKWDNLEDSIVQTSSVFQFITETRDSMTGSFTAFNF